jgi:hypothetical protein
MQRRHLLGTLWSATIAVACSPRLALAGRPAPTLAERLVGALRQRASAATVGRAYLAAHPADAGLERLTADLADDLCRQQCAPWRTTPAGLRAAFARRVRDDFAIGRVTRVDGWVLSLTEARLCGLAALVGGA